MSERTYHDSDDAAYWAEQGRELTRPVDPMVALEDAERRLSSIGGSSDPAHVARRVELTAEIARLRPLVATITAPAQAAHEVEWSRETTIARREAWNTAVRSGQYTQNGKLRIADLVKALGFHAEDLKAAVARHGL